MTLAVANFFNRKGDKIAEVKCYAPRSWMLSRYGQLKILIPYSDSNLREEIVRIGNFVTVESDILPIWGGVLEMPQNWRTQGLELTAFSGAYILRYRQSESVQKLKGTAGEIIQQIITLSNKWEDCRIRGGSIFMGGIDREETIEPKPLIDDIRRVAARANLDWDTIPMYDTSGRLIFSINVAERIGFDISGAYLEEGVNFELSNSTLSEDGLLVNHVIGYGDGLTWSARPKSTVEDRVSIGVYGRREWSHEFWGNTRQTTVQKNTEEFVKLYSSKRGTLTFNVTNQYNVFNLLRLGNSLSVILHSIGFQGSGFGKVDQIRVYGLAYEEKIGRMTIAVIPETGTVIGVMETLP